MSFLFFFRFFWGGGGTLLYNLSFPRPQIHQWAYMWCAITKQTEFWHYHRDQSTQKLTHKHSKVLLSPPYVQPCAALLAHSKESTQASPMVLELWSSIYSYGDPIWCSVPTVIHYDFLMGFNEACPMELMIGPSRSKNCNAESSLNVRMISRSNEIHIDNLFEQTQDKEFIKDSLEQIMYKIIDKLGLPPYNSIYFYYKQYGRFKQCISL